MPKREYVVNPPRNPPMLQEEKFALLQATPQANSVAGKWQVQLVKAKFLKEILHETRQFIQQNNSPPT